MLLVLIGHRNMARLGGYLARLGRLDINNNIDGNGELLIQKSILGLDENPIVVVDCGANKGQWSESLLHQIETESTRQVDLYCFEPSSYTCEQLRRVIDTYSIQCLRSTVVQVALSSSNGSADLKIVHDGAGTNSLVSVPNGFEKEELIETMTIDSYAEENTVDQIHLFKIDAEGHDFEVILGARHLIAAKKVKVVQFEYNWRWIYANHTLLEVFNFFSAMEYKLGKVTPKGVQYYQAYDVTLESYAEGNYLAVAPGWERLYPAAPNWLKTEKSTI
jgi:FkbM family methyltransferase